jgi:hypothetical protein
MSSEAWFRGMLVVDAVKGKWATRRHGQEDLSGHWRIIHNPYSRTLPIHVVSAVLMLWNDRARDPYRPSLVRFCWAPSISSSYSASTTVAEVCVHADLSVMTGAVVCFILLHRSKRPGPLLRLPWPASCIPAISFSLLPFAILSIIADCFKYV